MTSETVRVTSKGQATIPSRFREKLGISAPGLVRFTERGGKLVVEPLPDPSAMRGVLKRAFGKESAQELLRRERAADKQRETRKTS